MGGQAAPGRGPRCAQQPERRALLDFGDLQPKPVQLGDRSGQAKAQSTTADVAVLIRSVEAPHNLAKIGRGHAGTAVGDANGRRAGSFGGLDKDLDAETGTSLFRRVPQGQALKAACGALRPGVNEMPTLAERASARPSGSRT